MPSQNVNWRLREVLNAVFPSGEDFEAFVLDFFPSIHQRMGSAMDRVQKTSLLLRLAGAAASGR